MFRKLVIVLILIILIINVSCKKDPISSTNTAPIASFTVEPTSGTTATVFTFDASGSTDNEDTISDLQVRWDWENDDTYETNYNITKTATHQYSTPGTYTVKLEIKDSGGLTKAATMTVSVQQQNLLVTKKWTFLLYDDADENGIYDPLEDFAIRVSSGVDVNYIVLQDGWGSPGKLYYIDDNHQKQLLEAKNEINMGDPNTLSDFIVFAKENYPAERYILSMYDHGAGWLGCCWDETNDGDGLLLGEFKQALAVSGGVDLVLFSAPCLMGNLESAYNLRDYTDIYIGSEELSGYIWWQSPMSDISIKLNGNPDISNIDLAEFIIQSIHNNCTEFAEDDWISSLTMSAIETSKLGNLSTTLDELSKSYLPTEKNFSDKFDSIKDNVKYFYKFMDLKTFLDGLLRIETDPILIKNLEDVNAALNEAVIAEYHGAPSIGLGGLTILGPDKSNESLLPYYGLDYYGLDFVKDTNWDELLNKYAPNGKYVNIYRKPTIVDFKSDGWINFLE